MSVVLTVAPTGPIAVKSDNPHLPTSPEDLTIARRTTDLIRERYPILIQMFTGVGLTVSFEDREKLVELDRRSR